MEQNNYLQDKKFLQQHLELFELQSGDCKLLLSPQLQGRILTSTSQGDEGYSFGWLNKKLISSGTILPHCNNWGGEDRFWLGPEGGQFSLFFPKGTDFSFQDWQTPSLIDTESWSLVSQRNDMAEFMKEAELVNCSGFKLKFRLDRKVSLLQDKNCSDKISTICFQTENCITNIGDSAWTETVGMPSIWILGQFKVSEKNTIVIPYRQHQDALINDRYFGKIDSTRLKSDTNTLYFKGDGKKRGKIGIPPEMVLPTVGAYDAENGILTIVNFTLPSHSASYVNSMWEWQEQPFKGDVLNAYNDGPLEDGSIMGPFYELESSSPAAALNPGEILKHVHTTTHYYGDLDELDRIARIKLGKSLGEIDNSLL